jgi:hypothetical protein
VLNLASSRLWCFAEPSARLAKTSRPFDANLVLQQFPPPYDESALVRAARTLGLDMQLAKNPNGRFTPDISIDSREPRDLGLGIALLGGASGMADRLNQIARLHEVQQFDLTLMH